MLQHYHTANTPHHIHPFWPTQSGFGTRKRGNGGGNGFARVPPKQKARLAPRRNERPDSNPADLGDHDGDGNGPNLYCESQVVTYN